MSFILRNIARYAAQKLASDPRVRETANKAARVVVDEAERIARREDKALNAGRAVRRAMNKLARPLDIGQRPTRPSCSPAPICRSAKSTETDKLSVILGR